MLSISIIQIKKILNIEKARKTIINKNENHILDPKNKKRTYEVNFLLIVY